MSSVLTTIIIAAILVLLAVAGLAISLIITGKSRIRVGRCGWNPKMKRDESCGKKIKCPLCEKEPQKEPPKAEEEEEEDEPPHSTLS